DSSQVFFTESVLKLAVLVAQAGINEQHVVISLALAEHQEGNMDGCVREHLGRQCDHGINQVFLQKLLSDLLLSAAAEQYAERHNHCHTPCVSLEGRNHVADERIVSRCAWWDATLVTAPRIVACI